ncbi:MAG: flagellin lysine-N-methylase [Pyramidobacter sp.]|uniref:flagellin lysine-N-methylase n=1 Tax=Pyramidobacter sp. TaxID=1943581 RepID=UPI002A806EE7|nr:flagellin lysine-N-methylase [Pyramidobacter sp.]MDY4031898.1 flagellin lysine-N-methylase [Pyramidobacter sp.]
MAGTQQILVPEYFPKFQCKCGACRSCCCSGWGVSVSRTDYFRLLGMNCTASLRKRLDRAFSVLPDATPERYAGLNHDWRGRCYLQREDGYCALQRERGEAAIPGVCRLYPRGLRAAFEGECACANSCERTLELLLEQREPLRFLLIEKPASLPDFRIGENPEAARRDRERRDRCLAILQDRCRSVPQRLMDLGALAEPVSASPEPDRAEAFRLCALLLSELAGGSLSLSGYASEVFALYGVPFAAGSFKAVSAAEFAPAVERYVRFSDEFAADFPVWPTFAEHLLVNHVFFAGFPASAATEAMKKELAAFCAAYALTRFMAVGWTREHRSAEALIDVCAAAFRFIEHGNFARNAPIVLREAGALSPDGVAKLALG